MLHYGTHRLPPGCSEYQTNTASKKESLLVHASVPRDFLSIFRTRKLFSIRLLDHTSIDELLNRDLFPRKLVHHNPLVPTSWLTKCFGDRAVT